MRCDGLYLILALSRLRRGSSPSLTARRRLTRRRGSPSSASSRRWGSRDARRRDDGLALRLVRRLRGGLFRRGRLFRRRNRGRGGGLSHSLRRRVGIADGQEAEGQDRGGEEVSLG